MGKYRLQHTGPQVDAGIDAALNPDTVPTSGSDALVTSDAVASVQAGLAPFENGMTSSAPYSIGDLLVRQGILYKAKTAIAVGDAFTVDSNIEVATIAEVLANFDPGPAPYTSDPSMDGTASPGSSGQYADGAHVHPHDTSIQQISAPTLTSPASENIAAGAYRVYNNLLYQVGAAISSGETASSFESKLTAVPEGGLNALKSALTTAEELSVTWNTKANYNANTCKVTRQGKLVSICAQMSMGYQSIAAGEALISGLPSAAKIINGIYAISDTPNPKISVFSLYNGELCPREAIPSYSGGGYIYLYFVYTAAD